MSNLEGQHSHLFACSHIVGLVTDGSPVSFSSTSPGNGHVAVRLKKSYYIMEIKNLSVLLRSAPFPYDITAIYTAFENTYIAIDQINQIVIHHNLQEIGRFSGHRYEIIGMLCVGGFLISWSKHEVLVWDLESRELHGNLDITTNSGAAFISKIIHPETYINKILVAFKDGGDLQLWNFRTLKHIHSFSSVNPTISSSISAISLSSNPDIVVIGYESGELKLVDIQHDKLLCSFQHASNQGAVTSICIVTDGTGVENGLIISGCKNGDMVLWNSKEQLMMFIVESAHLGSKGVTSLFGFPGEPLLLSSGDDNAIIVWILDGSQHHPRELRSRKGMQSSAEFLCFYDNSDQYLLGLGTVKKNLSEMSCLSVKDVIQAKRMPQKKAMSQITRSWRNRLVQLPKPTSMDVAFSRHYDWGNIVTIHHKLPSIFIWSGHDSCLLARTIQYPKSSSKAPIATAVSVSGCGNYVAAGYDNGAIELFNLQSGLHRGSLMRKPGAKAHAGRVCQILVQESTQIYSASSDSSDFAFCSWDLSKRRLESECFLGELLQDKGLHCIRNFSVSGVLTAVVVASKPSREKNGRTKDLSMSDSHMEKVVLIDAQLKAVVREFPLIKDDSICCLRFSRDNHWILFSTEQPPQLFIYDILSSTLIDWIIFPSPALTFALDTSSAFLYVALEHLKGGVQVLAAKDLYNSDLNQLTLRNPVTAPIAIGQPLEKDEHVPEEIKEPLVNLGFSRRLTPLEPNALTLSMESEGRIQAITHLEELRQRNKPRNVVDTSVRAPFFLMGSAAADTGKDMLNNDSKLLGGSDLRQTSLGSAFSPFKQMLKEFSNAENEQGTLEIAKRILTYLKTLSPTAIHLELSDLDMLCGMTAEDLETFLDVLHALTYERIDADFVQALLNVYLQLHRNTIEEFILTESDEEKEELSQKTNFKRKLTALRNLLYSDWNPLDLQFHQSECFLKFLTHCQIE